MASMRHYTASQLLALRESPLVAKPDDLPSIEQWLEFVYLESDGVREKLRIPHSESANTDQRQHNAPGTKENKRNRTLPSTTTADSPMGAFSTGRPTLGTRNSTLSRATGDDISLGPPKTVFASSRHNSRLADLSSGDAVPVDDAENARSKFFADRQQNRRSGILDKDGRDNRDSWTRAAERRAMGGEDEGKLDKTDRYGRHDTQDGERRNGFGEKGDPRWSNTRGDERRQNGERPAGGWREREQARRNGGGGDRHNDEREPEWMEEDVVVKKDAELGLPQAKTQDEFQKWKESMSKKTKGEPEKEEAVQAQAPQPPPPEPKPSLKLDGFDQGSFFGGFPSASSGLPTPLSANATPPAAALPAKAPGKGKTSRYASMFKPAAEEPPPPPPESDLQKAANGIAKTTAEEQEGFNRVLQMLGGGLKIGGQPTPPSETPSAPSAPQSPPQPTRAGANGSGSKPKSRFFQAQPKSPDQMQSPQLGGVHLGGGSHLDRGLTEEPASFGGRNEQPRPPQETPEPNNMFNVLREQQPRPSSGRVSELAMFDPPSRSAPSPDINIQNLLAQQRQRPQHTSHESQNLLNLLKKSDPAQQLSRPPSQQTGFGDAQMQRWLEHQHPANSHIETYAPKPARLPQQPPGLFEEQLMRNFPSREELGREQQMPPGVPEPRRQQQRAPPGFYDEREILMQQQMLQQQQQQMRRNFEQPPPQIAPPQQQQQVRRHQTLPSMNQPQQYQGEYHITSPGIGSAGGGPPGFHPHMPRHPPGFGATLPQQHFQQQQREPPPGSMPPGFGPPPQSQAPPPPGFYGNAPPGFSQPMPPPGMRSRTVQQPQQPFDPYEMARRG